MSANDHNNQNFKLLVIGAIGVVFGDIGTSPLYAIRESFEAFHLPIDKTHIYGLMSLVFWLLLSIVSCKYITFIMKADNRGEGGNLALLALALRLTRKIPSLYKMLGLLGMIGGSLFFADAAITPAISVMSAIEGLKIVAPSLSQYILPLSITILACLFYAQKFGTGKIGALFGPVTIVWFSTMAILGVMSIMKTPEILNAINPLYAYDFFILHPALSFLTLGSAVLVVTGAEALYADMGHFGRKPITYGWFIFVWPCLLMNYFGQAALLIRAPQAIENPFYLLAPEFLMVPLLFLATMATIIASQAVITGAFSVTRQAILLGYIPRLRIQHTSDRTAGQIYIPTVNWLLFGVIFIIIVSFKSSGALAAAYGLAITGDMIITSFLFLVVAYLKWKWKGLYIAAFAITFFTIELALFGANINKIAHGAWLPVVIGCILVSLFSTWHKGQALLNNQYRVSAQKNEDFLKNLNRNDFANVSGTAFYLSRQAKTVPPSFIKQLRHTKVLHEHIIFLTVNVTDAPYLMKDQERFVIQDFDNNIKNIIFNYGFKEQPNLKRDLELLKNHGVLFNWHEASFFLGTENIIPIKGHGMPMWRDWIFMMMKRNSGDIITFLNLPPERVVELKSQHVI